MENGIFAESSLMNFVNIAKGYLKITTTDEDISLERSANEAIQHLDILSILVKKQCTLTVSDHKAKLPAGYAKLIGIRASSGQNYSQLVYVDLPFLNNCGANTIGSNIVSINGVYQIQGGYIHITNNPNILDEDNESIPLTEITLAYWGLNVDENGLMIGLESYERAIVAYICYKYTLQNFDQFNQYVIESYQSEWKAQKAYLKSKEQQDQFNNTKRQVAASMNSWISSKVWTT